VSEFRRPKFRQAAFAYLIVGMLYESVVIALWRNGDFPTDRGPVVLWLLIGAAVTALIVWLLWRYSNPWIPRIIFAIHALRLPTLIDRAFFPAEEGSAIPASLFGAALIVVVINLWMLARAGWDL
jgi:hypothetical protein